MGRFVWCVEEIWGEAVLNPVVDDEKWRRRKWSPGWVTGVNRSRVWGWGI
jgi:hypothetical protein